MAIPVLDQVDVANIVQFASNIGAPRNGGQKIVFPCEINGQQYVLKFLLVGIGAESHEVFARVQREVQIMERCQSPHIVRLGSINLTSIDYNGQSLLYYSEDHINGDDMSRIMQPAVQLNVDVVVKMGIHISRAISELWSHSKVHRDIKPGNIMHCNDTSNFILLDMGFAFDLTDSSLSGIGMVPGTLRYLSPDQLDLAHKRQIDFRSDLFALGIVMYEALTGRHPFYTNGMTQGEMIASIKSVNPPPPSQYNVLVPDALNTIILRLLAKRAHMRFRTCTQLIDNLLAI